MWPDRTSFADSLFSSAINLRWRGVRRSIWVAIALAILAAEPAAAIVGPSDVDNEDGSSVVTLLSKGPEGAGFCTGIVLSSKVVLTAAHCIRPPQDMVILTRSANGEPKLWPVEKVERHPRYHGDVVASRQVSIDIALVLLASPLGDDHHPMPFAEDQAPELGDAITIVGYGVTRPGDPKSGGALRRGRLSIRAPISNVLLWADGDGEPVGACSGDSGAPLLDAQGGLIAVVAWADGGARRGCAAA